MSLCNCSHQFCKNIPVSFDFITTWNQEMFLCSPCIYKKLLTKLRSHLSLCLCIMSWRRMEQWRCNTTKFSTTWIWVHSCALTWFDFRRGISRSLLISGNPGRRQKYPLTEFWLGNNRAKLVWLTLQETVKHSFLPLYVWSHETMKGYEGR